MAAAIAGLAAGLLPALMPETMANIGHYIDHDIFNQDGWGRHKGGSKKRKYAGLNPGLAAYLAQEASKKIKSGDGRPSHHMLTPHGVYQYNGPHKTRLYKANGLTPTAGPIQFGTGEKYAGKRGVYKMHVTYHGVNGTTQRHRAVKARGLATEIPSQILTQGPMP